MLLYKVGSELLCPVAWWPLVGAGVAGGRSSSTIDVPTVLPVPFRCCIKLFMPVLPMLDPRFTLELGLEGSAPKPSSSVLVSFCCCAFGSADLIFSAFSGYKLNMFRYAAREISRARAAASSRPSLIASTKKSSSFSVTSQCISITLIYS